jgi:hypothetical protein
MGPRAECHHKYERDTRASGTIHVQCLQIIIEEAARPSVGLDTASVRRAKNSTPEI